MFAVHLYYCRHVRGIRDVVLFNCRQTLSRIFCWRCDLQRWSALTCLGRHTVMLANLSCS